MKSLVKHTVNAYVILLIYSFIYNWFSVYVHAASILHNLCMYVYKVNIGGRRKWEGICRPTVQKIPSGFWRLPRCDCLIYICMLTSQHRSPECQIGTRSTEILLFFFVFGFLIIKCKIYSHLHLRNYNTKNICDWNICTKNTRANVAVFSTKPIARFFA